MDQEGITRRTTLGSLRALLLPYLDRSAKGEGGGGRDPAPTGNVHSSLASLKAFDTRHKVALLAGVPGVSNGRITWTWGDYGATPSNQLDRNVFKADATPLSRGAWVREDAEDIAFLQGGRDAQPRTLQSKVRDIVSVLDFGAKGDGVTDDTAAFDAAIATGRTVYVPCVKPGYVVGGIKVVSNMQIVGEKAGLSQAPLLIVRKPNTAAFFNSANDNIFHCVFENLACQAADGVAGTSFYTQSAQDRYSAYFTFRNIETYKNLRSSYTGLFIFALWDRCRDGYLGNPYGGEHSAIVGLAGSYGQLNQQNVNRIRDSMFFGAFGGAGAIIGSYGVLWTIENTNFEAMTTRAFMARNIRQVRFSNCWFEDISASSLVHAGNYPGSTAASTMMFDCCHFVLTGTAPHVATLEDPSTIAFRSNLFTLIGPGTRLCPDGARVTVNEDNLAVSGPGAANLFSGTHHDSYSGGRRYLNGAADNRINAMTVQNDGGIAATDGFMSRADIRVGTQFVTIATSRTGLGGTCIISGYDPNGGLQLRLIKDWQGATIRDVAEAVNATGKALTFRVAGQDLQMKVNVGSVVIFTTMMH